MKGRCRDLMKISDIRIRIVKKDDNKLKAVASLTIDDCFAVHDIKVIELNGDEGYFVAMPSRKDPDGKFKDIVHPINTETRESISTQVIEAYKATPRE